MGSIKRPKRTSLRGLCLKQSHTIKKVAEFDKLATEQTVRDSFVLPGMTTFDTAQQMK